MVACVAYFNLIEVIVPGNIYMVYRDSEQKNIETFWNENDKEESENEAKNLKESKERCETKFPTNLPTESDWTTRSSKEIHQVR